jgi:hypothetical protein
MNRDDTNTLYVVTKHNSRIYLSDETYTLSTEYNGPHRNLIGNVLRLASGVDMSNTPGYHYNPGWTAVIPADGIVPEHGVCGLERKYLTLVE